MHSRAHIGQPDWSAEDEADRIAEQVAAELEEAPKMPMSMAVTKTDVKKNTKQEPVVVDPAAVKADAANAHEAASVAKHAAKVANKVAQHSIHITKHAKKAL